MRTLLLEEHAAVGVPVHCSGFLGLVTRPALTEEVVASIDRRIVLAEYHHVRVFAPNGKVVQEIPATSCYLVERAGFDRDLARQAVNAGVDLLLATRVTGLARADGRVTGVTTASRARPRINGRMVIAADGLYATRRGLPYREGFTRPDQTFTVGVGLELTKVRGIDPGVCEFHAGAFTPKGYTTLWPRDEVSCMTHFASEAELRRVREGKYALSEKLRDAIPVRMTAYSHSSDLGVGLPRLVKESLVLTGTAAGWRGILPAMASGRMAGEVAAEAIRRGDVSAESLRVFEEMCERLRGAKGYVREYPFRGACDEEIERFLVEMIENGEGPFYRPLRAV